MTYFPYQMQLPVNWDWCCVTSPETFCLKDISSWTLWHITEDYDQPRSYRSNSDNLRITPRNAIKTTITETAKTEPMTMMLLQIMLRNVVLSRYVFLELIYRLMDGREWRNVYNSRASAYIQFVTGIVAAVHTLSYFLHDKMRQKFTTKDLHTSAPCRTCFVYVFVITLQLTGALWDPVIVMPEHHNWYLTRFRYWF